MAVRALRLPLGLAIAFGGAALAAVATLPAFAPYTWIGHLISQVLPHIAVAGMVLAILGLMLGSRVAIVVGVVLAGVTAGQVWEPFLQAFPVHREVTRPVPGFTATTIDAGHATPDRDALADYVATLEPEILFLQRAPIGERGESRGALGAALPEQIHCEGMAVLSIWPIVDHGREQLAAGGGSLCWARLNAGGRTITTASLYLHHPFTGVRFEDVVARPRAAYARIREATEMQLREIEGLARFVAGQEGPVMLGGAFNANPWSTAMQAFAGTADVPSVAGGIAWTYPPAMPVLAIDNVLASGGVTIVHRKTGLPVVPDGLPLVVQVAWVPDDE